MVKNTTGGNKHKKHKRVSNYDKKEVEKLILADNKADIKQLYAQVIKKVGGKRLQVKCSDGKERSCRIPGSFYKRVWFNVGDIMLCELNTIGNDDMLCSALLKYNENQINSLKMNGHLDFVNNDTDNIEDDQHLLKKESEYVNNIIDTTVDNNLVIDYDDDDDDVDYLASGNKEINDCDVDEDIFFL